MKRSHRQTAMMRVVVQIRDVQRLAAQSALQTADERLQSAAHALETAQTEHLGHEHAWLASVSGPRLDLQMQQAWAWAVHTAEVEVRAYEAERAAAEGRRQGAVREVHVAEGRLELAQDVARRLRRHTARRDEEARLAASMDMAAARRRGRP